MTFIWLLQPVSNEYKMVSGGSDSKESACNAGDLGSIPGSGRSPGGGHGNPLQYSCLEYPHGQRSLTGYSPCGHTESDTTEGLSHTQHMKGIKPLISQRTLRDNLLSCLLSLLNHTGKSLNKFPTKQETTQSLPENQQCLATPFHFLSS